MKTPFHSPLIQRHKQLVPADLRSNSYNSDELFKTANDIHTFGALAFGGLAFWHTYPPHHSRHTRRYAPSTSRVNRGPSINGDCRTRSRSPARISASRATSPASATAFCRYSPSSRAINSANPTFVSKNT